MKVNPKHKKQAHKPYTDRSVRFWSKVKRDKEGECWNWQSSVSNSGYGVFWERIKGKKLHTFAHRAAYELEVGTIDDGLVVMHLCHNKLCCNPRHLRLGTQRENIDMSVKAGHYREIVRKRRDSDSYGVINKASVDEIRKAYREGYTTKELAKVVGVSVKTILVVLKGLHGYEGIVEPRVTSKELVERGAKEALKVRHGKRGLSPQEIQAIRELHRYGRSVEELAKRYNRSLSSIRRIINHTHF